MEKIKVAPICKCGKSSVERHLINSSFWYCTDCKDEVKDSLSVKSIRVGNIDPAGLMVPTSGVITFKGPSPLQFNPNPFYNVCSHYTITRNLTNGTWNCDVCGKTGIVDPNNP